MLTLYDVLGVDQSASFASIKEAYRTQRLNASTSRRRELKSAHSIVGHPKRRFAYDGALMMRSSQKTSTGSLEATWAQAGKEVEILLADNTGNLRERNIEVKVTSRHITVTMDGRTIVDGDLAGPVKEKGTVWVVDATTVRIGLEKVTKSLWPAVTVGGWPDVPAHAADPLCYYSDSEGNDDDGNDGFDAELAQEVCKLADEMSDAAKVARATERFRTSGLMPRVLEALARNADRATEVLADAEEVVWVASGDSLAASALVEAGAVRTAVVLIQAGNDALLRCLSSLISLKEGHEEFLAVDGLAVVLERGLEELAYEDPWLRVISEVMNVIHEHSIVCTEKSTVDVLDTITDFLVSAATFFDRVPFLDGRDFCVHLLPFSLWSHSSCSTLRRGGLLPILVTSLAAERPHVAAAALSAITNVSALGCMEEIQALAESGTISALLERTEHETHSRLVCQALANIALVTLRGDAELYRHADIHKAMCSVVQKQVLPDAARSEGIKALACLRAAGLVTVDAQTAGAVADAILIDGIRRQAVPLARSLLGPAHTAFAPLLQNADAEPDLANNASLFVALKAALVQSSTRAPPPPATAEPRRLAPSSSLAPSATAHVLTEQQQPPPSPLLPSSKHALEQQLQVPPSASAHPQHQHHHHHHLPKKTKTKKMTKKEAKRVARKEAKKAAKKAKAAR